MSGTLNQSTCTGNAATATALTSAGNKTIDGDVDV